jgi:hypothetical protein
MKTINKGGLKIRVNVKAGGFANCPGCNNHSPPRLKVRKPSA